MLGQYRTGTAESYSGLPTGEPYRGITAGITAYGHLVGVGIFWYLTIQLKIDSLFWLKFGFEMWIDLIVV